MNDVNFKVKIFLCSLNGHMGHLIILAIEPKMVIIF